MAGFKSKEHEYKFYQGQINYLVDKQYPKFVTEFKSAVKKGLTSIEYLPTKAEFAELYQGQYEVAKSARANIEQYNRQNPSDPRTYKSDKLRVNILSYYYITESTAKKVEQLQDEYKEKGIFFVGDEKGKLTIPSEFKELTFEQLQHIGNEFKITYEYTDNSGQYQKETYSGRKALYLLLKLSKGREVAEAAFNYHGRKINEKNKERALQEW